MGCSHGSLQLAGSTPMGQAVWADAGGFLMSREHGPPCQLPGSWWDHELQKLASDGAIPPHTAHPSLMHVEPSCGVLYLTVSASAQTPGTEMQVCNPGAAAAAWL